MGDVQNPRGLVAAAVASRVRSGLSAAVGTEPPSWVTFSFISVVVAQTRAARPLVPASWMPSGLKAGAGSMSRCPMAILRLRRRVGRFQEDLVSAVLLRGSVVVTGPDGARRQSWGRAW